MMSGSYKDHDDGCGDLMAFLESQRSLFENDEEFRAFAVGQVRRFVRDLRRLGIEVSMRPTYLERPLSSYSPSRAGN